RRRHTRSKRDWSSDVCSSDLPLIAALIEADAPLGISDQFELRRLQLKVLHIKPLVHTARVEEKLMGGDSEEGASQLPDSRLVEEIGRASCREVVETNRSAEHT